MADTYSSVNRGSPLPAAVRGEWDDASDALTELRECSRLGCLPTFREAGMEPRALLAVNAELRVVVGDRSPGTPVTQVFDVPSLWVATGVLLAALPAGITPYLFAQRYGACQSTVASAVFLSTLVSVGTLSALLFVLRP